MSHHELFKNREQRGPTVFGKKSDEEKAAAKRQRQITAAAASAGLTVMGGQFRAPNQDPVPVEGARITIENGDQVMLCPVPAKKEGAARILATMVNGEATGVGKSE